MKSLQVEINLLRCDSTAVARMRERDVLKVRLLPGSATDASERAIASGEFAVGAMRAVCMIRVRTVDPDYVLHIFGHGISDTLVHVAVNMESDHPEQPPLKRNGSLRLFTPQDPCVTITEAV